MSPTQSATRYLLIIGLAACCLGCGLTELLRTSSESTLPPASATPQLKVTSTRTLTTTPSAAETSIEVDTPTPPPATAPPTRPPTETVTPKPTEPPQGLSIISFRVELVDASGGGKEIHCTWETFGASGVQILVGTRQRFPIWRDGDPNGNATFEVAETYYNNPKVTLTAHGINGGEISESVSLIWSCDDAYFFDAAVTDSQVCPASAPLTVQGAQQPFQDGAMLWIPDIDGYNWVYVLYNDGTWQRYEDTWLEGMSESDPDIVPPPGSLQPVRGFGKVWREYPDVRANLGWATTGETAVTITTQSQKQESIGGVRYIRTAGTPLVRLDGIGGSGSTWTSLP